MADSRRCWVTVEYDGKSITAEVTASLKSMTFRDKSAEEADEIDLVMHDRECRWHTDWYPKVKIKAKEAEQDTDDSADDSDWDGDF